MLMYTYIEGHLYNDIILLYIFTIVVVWLYDIINISQYLYFKYNINELF